MWKNLNRLVLCGNSKYTTLLIYFQTRLEKSDEVLRIKHLSGPYTFQIKKQLIWAVAVAIGDTPSCEKSARQFGGVLGKT